MTSTIRRLAAYLLLALLPLQAFAGAGVVSCAERMPHCPGMHAAAGGCCDHGASAGANGVDHAAHAGSVQPDMSPCAGANTCAPLMSLTVVLPAVALIAALPAEEAWHIPDSASYLSFIPDGLHRPPALLA